jgi:hypothetical protein
MCHMRRRMHASYALYADKCVFLAFFLQFFLLFYRKAVSYEGEDTCVI